MQKIIKKFFFFFFSEKVMILFGILGLIPFIIGLIALCIKNSNLYFLYNTNKIYGVIILTFLGGIYWGLILQNYKNQFLPNKLKFLMILWSVIPSIFGIIILTIENNLSLIILLFGFVGVQIIDETFNKFLFFPKWYMMLRRFLSLLVIIILFISYLIIENK